MPEVAGDGAIFVNPLNVDDIEVAFQSLAQNNHEDLISKGYKNTERFSWGKASNKTLNVLCEASSSKCDRVI
jgi:glycosyltransferase involved in cell wall biosynthesis